MSSDRSSDPGRTDPGRSEPAALVVVAARRSTIVSLVDVLRDWSSIGLIGPVHAVDVDSMRPGELLVPCTVVAAGANRGAVLQEEAASRESADMSSDTVRLCALTEITDTVSSVSDDEALSLLETVRTALPGVEIVPLHLIGIALHGATPTQELGWLGWHNVVIAPENSLAPTQGVSPIVSGTNDPVRVTHFAAAVCSLGGLWAAEPSGPLDARPIAPGRAMVAARSFTRHLSAAAVESELLTRLADVGQGYPVPLFEGASAWVIEDEVAAVTDMAEALLTKHADLFARPREMPRPTPPKRIGAIDALKMLFTFLGQAIRNAPKAFLNRAISDASARTAALVGGAVFGKGEAAYAVVVHGVRADGLPASWADIDEALEVAAAHVVGRPAVHRSDADLSTLWKDFVGGGLTLLDAGARSPEMPPRMTGSRRGIVTTATRVAPDPAECFAPAQGVAPYLRDPEVSSYDPVAARALHDQLATLGERQPHILGQVSSAKTDLQHWFRDRERSYTGRVGLRLMQAVAGVRDEITSYSAALRAAQSASEVPSQIEQQQRGLASKLKLACVLALLAFLAVGVITALGSPGWRFLVAMTVAIAAVWLAASLAMFIRGQRDLFTLLHRRRELTGQVEILRQHLADALEDMRRLSRAYRQYLDWAKAFGRFVQAPLGRPSAQADSEFLIGSGFPRNHRFGAARPDDVVLDETAAMMKRDMFGVGWASEAWQAFIADVPREMGKDAFRLREDSDLLFVDPGVARDSLLSAWADTVVKREDWLGATETLRERVDGLLGGPDAGFAPQLLADVDTRAADGTVESISYASFINRLDSEVAPSGPQQRFDRAIFADHAQGAEPWRVAEHLATSSSAHLGRTLVVTQLSRGFNPYDLSLGPQRSPTEPEPSGTPATSTPRQQPHRPVM